MKKTKTPPAKPTAKVTRVTLNGKPATIVSHPDAKVPGVRAPAPPDPCRVARGTALLSEIRPSPANPRKTFPAEGLRDLAASIAAAGLQQPLVVRPVPLAADFVDGAWVGLDHFELIDGERRYRALGTLPDPGRVPVTVRWLDDAQALAAAVVANDQREDVRPSEQAAAYARLAEGRTAEAVAELVGKPVGFVRGLLRLARLPAWALAAVDAGTLPRATAELVARVPGEESRRKAAGCVLLRCETLHELAGEWNDGDTWEQAVGRIGDGQLPGTEPLSYRDTRRLIAAFFQRELKTATFSKTALYVVDGRERPKCGDCPSRAGNDPEAKAEGTRADTCLDPDCYRGKTEEYRRLELEKAARKYGAVPAEPGFNWLFAEQPPAGWCDLEALAVDTEIGPELAGSKKGREKLLDLVRWPGFVPGQCQVVAAWGPGGKLRLIAKTTHVRRTLVDGEVLPKPEPRQRTRPPATTTPEPERTSAPQTPPAVARCEKCKATFDAAGKSKCPSCSAALRPPLISKVSDWDADEKAVEIAAQVLGEFAECNADDLKAIEATAGEDRHCSALFEVLEMTARFLVRDCCEFGHERKRFVEQALPQVKDHKFEAAVKGLSNQQLAGLCVRLVAGVVLDGEAGAKSGFGADLLAWAELDWPQLQDQARRVLAGEPSAEEKVAAAEKQLTGASDGQAEEAPGRHDGAGAEGADDPVPQRAEGAAPGGDGVRGPVLPDGGAGDRPVREQLPAGGHRQGAAGGGGPAGEAAGRDPVKDVSLAMPVRLVSVGEIPNVPAAVLDRLYQKKLGTLATMLADASSAAGQAGLDLPPRLALFTYLKDLKIPAGAASSGADAIVEFLASGEASPGTEPAPAGNEPAEPGTPAADSGNATQPPRDAFPPDVAGDWEHRFAGPGRHDCPADQETKALIAEWRERQRTGNDRPEWGKWSEFEVLLKDNRTVRVCYVPDYFDHTDHFEFFGEATSCTGYRSDFQTFEKGERPKITVDAWALRRAEELAAAETVEKANREKREAREAKKAGLKALAPKKGKVKA